MSQHNLAAAYQANGQIKEAVKLLEAVVSIQAEVLAEDHLDRLASQHDLARAYQANGQIKEAVKLLEAVVAIQAEVLAEDHPSRLASQHQLAIAYEASRGSEYEQSPSVQARTTCIEYPTSQAQPPRERHLFQEVRELLPLDMFEQQTCSHSQIDAAASEVTNTDSTVTNNIFTFGTSNSVPNITISVTTSPPGGNKRPAISDEEDDSSVESEEPPALSTRSRKRARMDG